MKDYCVDLKIARELKENGFSQNSFFCWYKYNTNDISICSKPMVVNETRKICSAPISDEILKELPNEIMGYILEIIRYDDGTIEADYTRNLQYEDTIEYLIKSGKLFYKLSNCLAELWMDLKKKKNI